MMPTQRLITTGPFQYCRNPMTLGTILAYLGLSIAAATIVGITLVVALAALLLVYLKRIEEKELTERFSEEYLAYRRDVPFIIPRILRRS
jgi:protein-S-isoprenylcysteine O-methyltransferase Ste14